MESLEWVIVDQRSASVITVPCVTTWYTIWTCRGGNVHRSDMSVAVARRLLPKMLARYGEIDQAGLFVGSVITVTGGAS